MSDKNHVTCTLTRLASGSEFHWKCSASINSPDSKPGPFPGGISVGHCGNSGNRLGMGKDRTNPIPIPLWARNGQYGLVHSNPTWAPPGLAIWEG